MKREQLRETILARPARPSVIHLTNGQDFLVPHPDYLFFPPPDAGAIVILVGKGGRLSIIDLDQIAAVSTGPEVEQAAG